MSNTSPGVEHKPLDVQDTQKLRWWTSPRTILRHLLMLDDTRHSIALGTAIGMFIGLTPTGGIQMLLVLGASWLCRPFFKFNQIAGLLAVYVSNPLTAIPIFWADYSMGAIFFSNELSPGEFQKHIGLSSELGWFDQVRWLYANVGAPFIIGSLIVAVIGGVLTYPLMRVLLSVFHLRRKKSDLVATPAEVKVPAVAVRD